jgi:hypothetical protein
MPVADLEILRRDLMVYLTTIVRILNAPIHPFDYAAAVDEMRAAVSKYHEAASGEIDLGPIVHDFARLAGAIAAWRMDMDARVAQAPGDHELRRKTNATVRRIARLLVPLNYARGERFDHDPALVRRRAGLEPAASRAAPAEMKRFARWACCGR